jgi:hypothetical protein
MEKPDRLGRLEHVHSNERHRQTDRGLQVEAGHGRRLAKLTPSPAEVLGATSEPLVGSPHGLAGLDIRLPGEET